MALVTVQRSPSPSDSPESDDGEEGDAGDEQASLKSPGRQRRSKSALKRLKKFFHTVRFISKLRPCISESYFAVKGAALILPQNDCGDYTYTQKITRQRHATQGAVTGDIQSHLQAMFYLLRSQDTIKVAVKLESVYPTHNRYMAVVSCWGKQDTEESVILGIDCNETATIGLVLPIWADTSVNLNGDGGFVVCSENKENIFKPVSVQAMWSALQSLNKVVKVARDNMYIPPGLTHTWVGYYKSRILSERSCITEWFTSEDLDEMRLNPIKVDTTGDPDQNLQNVIKSELKQIMMRVDLDEVTSRFLRETLEIKLQMSLKKYKSFVDQEMMTILGQLDAPSLIKDYLYLGSEWNASNLEELTENGVDHILNISREVDNFFPEVLKYMNIKEWDNEEADLFKHWNNTFEFIAKARRENSKVLVHCRMGISRSSSTVMAYLMKAYNMTRQEAFDYVKAIRPCVMPNSAFWKQLETYDGILNASRRRMIFKSKSEQNLTHQIPTKETEKDDVQPPEEKFMKDDLYLPVISRHHDNEDSVFSCDNPGIGTDALMFDIENSSRSADSTEESVDIPSPKADSWKSPSYGVYHHDDRSSTGDVPETDSSNVSDAEEDSEVKKITASPKKDLDPVDGGPTQLMSTLVKYKEDSSWIKEAAETKVGQQSESPKTVVPITCQSTEKVDGADVETIATCASVQVSESGDSGEETVITSTEQVELGVTQHYVKEKIPWNPGTVKKQKQGFEEKSKEVTTNVNSGDETVPTLLLDGEVLTDVPDILTSDTNSTQVESKETKDMEIKDSDAEDQRRPSSVYDMEDIPLPVGIVKKTTKEIEERHKQSDSSPESPTKPLQRSSSLKERVTSKRKRESERRKTCMPILSPSAPTSSVSSPSPTKEFVFPPKSAEVCMETDTADAPKTEGEGQMTDNKCSGECSDIAVYKFGGEEITVEKGIVKKQKMGIEQKSRDGRESQITTPSSDGEKDVVSSDSRDSVTDESEKLINRMDSSCALGSASSVPTDKSVLPTETTAGSTQSAKQETGSVVETVNTEKSSLTQTQDLDTKHSKDNLTNIEKTAYSSEESVSIATSTSGSPSGAKSTFTKESSPWSPTSPPSTKRKKREGSDSRFDAETLELIREIGSALLNSPEKPGLDKEVEEQRAEEGGSLVKFLVRNIEKNTATAKKKHLKEIIIIDKETQEKRKKAWKFQGDSESAMATTETKTTESKQKPQLTTSLSSPALVVPKSETGSKDHKQTSFDNVTESTSDNPSNTHPQVLVPDKSGPDDKDHTEIESRDKVKNLVGKFELSERQTCAKPSVPSTSGKETKMLIIEQNSEDKTDLKSTETTVRKQTEVSSFDVNKDSKEMSKMSKELDSDQFSELRNLRQNLRKPGTRPKSAEPICGSNFHKQMKSSHAHTSTTEPSFTWDGKKVRKLHGKSHPLAKLETNRKHPFYNTM